MRRVWGAGTSLCRIRTLILWAVWGSGALAPARSPAQDLKQDLKRTCPAAEVEIQQIASVPESFSKRAAPPSIVEEDGRGGRRRLLAMGPMLGAMDAQRPEVKPVCLRDGVAIVATIDRSGQFNGAVLANVNWRPRIVFEVEPRRGEVAVSITWKMRQGRTEVQSARTPPDPEPQKYPTTVKLTLRR